MDPVIAGKLDDFNRRWRGLVLLRGVCGGLITFLGTLTAAALVDWLFVLPEWARFALSVVVYLGTASVAWWFCLRPLLRASDSRQIARLVEKAEPDLREDLLSAVELGASDSKHDSPELRALLQSQVADRMRDLRMDSLLPPQLIAFWLRGAAVAVALVAGLFLVPGLRYEQLVVRALAPMADVQRVSLTQIRLVEPADVLSFQPQGDNLPVVVEITGPEADRVVLETIPKDAPRESIAMPLLQGRQYGTTLALGAEAVEFRIRARDAMTPKFTVRTRPRPHVAKFEKVLNFPAYTKLAPQAVTDENGDLAALEGTLVELKLHLNQPVRDAAVSIEAKGQTNRIRLAVSAAPVLAAQVPILVPGTYRVHLTAAATGFENKFSPVYEIRPIADLVPRVAIDSPREDFIARPEEIIALQGTAHDDVGLAKVAQLVQVNEGAWTETVLAENSGTNAAVSRRWDLLQLGVSPGDRVNTKLAAVDLKGSRAESATLHIVIGSAGFDTARLAALDAKRQLHDSLSVVAVAASEFRRSLAFDAAQKLRNADAVQRQQILTAAAKSADELGRQLDRSASLTRDALKTAAPGREASDLALLARALSELRHGALGSARGELERLMQERGNAAADNTAINEATRAASQVADSAAQAEAAHREMLASAEADALLEQLGHLAREQEKINQRAEADSAFDPQAFTRLARRQSGATKEVAAAEEQFNSLRKHSPRGTGDKALKAQEFLKVSRQQMEKAVVPTQPAADLLPAARNLQRGVELAAAELRPVGKELAVRADKARDDLARLGGATANKLEQARKDVEAFAGADRKSADQRARGSESPFLEAQAQRLRERAENQLKAATEQVKDRAGAEELRRDSDAQFTADLTKASQALNAMRTAAGGAPPRQAESMKELEQALRALEAGRQLNELNQALGQLARAERWEKDSPDAASGRAREWEWASKRLQSAAKDARAAALPDRAVKAATDASRNPLAGELDREMSERQAGARRPADASAKFDKLAEAVQQAQREAEPALSGARAKLDQAAPKLSEVMTGLGRQWADMERATRAAQLASGDAARDEARRLASRQEDLNRQVEDLKQAVRRDANVQDLATPEGRERSRDADDAVAIMREPPSKAQEALNAAAAVRDAATQKASLAEASAQQLKMGETLNQLAQHYAAMESGRSVAASRKAMRKAEEELGVKDALDRNYGTVQRLNEMMAQTDQQRLGELEGELRRNAAMRQELGMVGRETLDDSRAALAAAEQRQAALAQRLADTMRGEGERTEAPAQLQQLLARVRRVVTNDLPPLNRELAEAKVVIASELNRTTASLNIALGRAPSDLTRPPEQLARAVGEMIPHLQTAANEMLTAAGRVRAALQIARRPEDVQLIQTGQAKVARVADEMAQLVALAQQVATALANRLTPGQSIARAASEQADLANSVAQAGADIARAGRHESRLGTPLGETLQQVGRDTARVADQNMRAALDALTGARNMPMAAQQMEQARRALAEQSAALGRALNEPAPQTAANRQQQPPQAGQPQQTARTNRIELADVVKELTSRLGVLATNTLPALASAAKAARSGAEPEVDRVQTHASATLALAPTNTTDPALVVARNVNNLLPPLRLATNEFVAATNKLTRAVQERAATAPPVELAALRTAQAAGDAASAEGTDLVFLAQRLVVALLNPNDPAVVQRAVDSSNAGRDQRQQQAGQPQGAQMAQSQGGQQSSPSAQSPQQAGTQAQSNAGQQSPPPQAGQGGQQSSQQASAQQSAQSGAQQSGAAQQGSQQSQQNSSGQRNAGQQQAGQGNQQGSQQAGSQQSARQGGQSSSQPSSQSGAQQGGQQASQGARASGQQQSEQGSQSPSQQGGGQQAGRQGGQQGSPQSGSQASGRGGQQGGQASSAQSGSREGSSQTAAGGRGGGAQNQAGQPTGPSRPVNSGRGASGSDGGQASLAGGSSFSSTQSRWLARSLDSLDSQMNPAMGFAQMQSQGGQPGGSRQAQGNPGQRGAAQPGPRGADETGPADGAQQAGSGKGSGEALNEAMKEQRASMQSSRAGGNVPGEGSPQPGDEAGQGTGTGNFSQVRGGSRGMLPGEVARAGGDWGRLPPKVAQGLAEGQREGVAGEFRQQVELYFKIVAEKAKERK